MGYLLPRDLLALASASTEAPPVMVRSASGSSCDDLEAGAHGSDDRVQVYCFQQSARNLQSERMRGRGCPCLWRRPGRHNWGASRQPRLTYLPRPALPRSCSPVPPDGG